MRSFLCILFVLLVVELFSQPGRPVLPETYSRNTTEDFRKDQELVEKCLVWLCKTPINEDVAFRSEVNYFVMEWLAGSPQITIDVKTKYAPFVNDYPELMFSLIHGMALYALRHKAPYDEEKIHLKGLETVCDMIETSETLYEQKELRRALKAKKRNKLKAYIEKEYLSQEK